MSKVLSENDISNLSMKQCCYSAVAAIASLYLIKSFFSNIWGGAGKDGSKRRLSFSSSLLIDGGGFPKHVGVCSPIINIAFYFQNCPAAEEIAHQCEDLLKFERFRCTPVQDSNGNWIFEDAKNGKIDILANHILSTVVDGEPNVIKKLEELAATDLVGYGEHPLWVVHRIENKGLGISMIIFRIHHVITDGIGLLDLFTNLFVDSKTKEKVSPVVLSENMRAKDNDNVLALPLSRFDTNLAFSSPSKKHLKMGTNMKTIIFPTIRLAFIKSLKSKAGVTVNDIMLSATGGAIKRYCQKQGDQFDGRTDLQCRALMPVAFPRPSDERKNPQTALRNKWTFMSVPIPIGGSTSRERVENCRKETTTLKNSPIALVQCWIQNYLLPLLPKALGQQSAYDLFVRHSLIFSNVLGTDFVPCFCDERIIGIQVVFPNLVPQVILMSLGQQMFYNMVVDGDIVKDPECLKSMYVEELKSMAIEYGLDYSWAAMLSDISSGGLLGIVDKDA